MTPGQEKLYQMFLAAMQVFEIQGNMIGAREALQVLDYLNDVITEQIIELEHRPLWTPKDPA